MSRSEKNNTKLAVLEVVKNKKDILFASFNDNAVTKKQKEEAWEEVLLKANSLGMVAANRKWTFARDNLFGLWKSRMLAKKDNSKKTGTGGGKSKLFDVVDEAILDIIGKDSPVIEGLNIREAGGDGADIPPSDSISQTTQHKLSSSSRKKRKSKSQGEDDEFHELKKKLLSVEIYKTTLEAYKLERELRLPLSEFTNKLNKSEDGKDDADCSVERILNLLDC